MPGRALTLLELVLVLAVLIAVAGLAVNQLGRGIRVRLGDDELEHAQVATRASLVAVRAAILGDARGPGFRADVGAFPAELADLVRQPAGTPEFDPRLATGWRGPYVTATGRTPAGEPTLIDGWGRALVLDASAGLRVVSAGPDGALGNADDLVVVVDEGP